MKGSQANERLVHALAKQVFRVLGTSPSGSQVALCYVEELSKASVALLNTSFAKSVFRDSAQLSSVDVYAHA